jgi:hypothetical protein
MGRNKDLESISSSISNTVLHKIIATYTNKKESIDHLNKEELEYRAQSLKKINEMNLTEFDKKIIKEKIIRKIQNKLITKYPDIEISEEVILNAIDEELSMAFK